uniref:Outer membrane efflux protein n=1 Tax=Solibacter usitatus (strain Ellin6076) TaxID=234267 RepID=Q01SJ3_SOLUE
MKKLQVIGSIALLSVRGLCAQTADHVTIEQAVQEAVDHNLGLLAERYNLSIADARIITAKLRPNPVLTAAVDYIDFQNHFNNDNQGGPTEYNIRTDFVLERGAKRERRIEVAQTAREVAQLQLLNTTRMLALDVENAFIDVLQAKDNLALARENLQAFRNIVEVNATRVRAGDLAKVELVRTQVAALQFQSAVRQAESKLKIAGNRLQTLMGRRVPSPTFEATGTMRRDSTPVVMETVATQALDLRPDLLALRKDQARSQAELRSQLAQGKVDFTVGTEFHRQFYNGNANALGVFFSSPLPVFNKNQGEIERARQEQQQILARIRAAEADVQNDVRNAWLQYATSRELLESIEHDLLDQAREVRTTMEYSYRRGEASLVEFLDAQRAFNDARQSYNDARADFARSLYTIDSISGKAVR